MHQLSEEQIAAGTHKQVLRLGAVQFTAVDELVQVAEAQLFSEIAIELSIIPSLSSENSTSASR